MTEALSKEAATSSKETMNKVKRKLLTKQKRQLFSQAAEMLLSETPANTPKKPVTVVNVHAEKETLMEKRKVVGAKKPSAIAKETQAVKKKATKLFKAPEKAKRPKKKSDDDPGGGKPRKKFLAPRRSSLEFVDHPDRKKTRKKVKSESTITNIVTTSCKKEDIDLVRQLANLLGGLRPSTNVSPGTSHVICGDNRRTLNILKGVALGCWVLRRDWLFACLEAERWVDEEPYEMVEFSPAVKKCRVERQAFGWTHYKSELFKDSGTIYVDRISCQAPAKDLVQLCEMAGGTTVKLARVADVVVGAGAEDTNKNYVHVDEKWILDSIQKNVALPIEDYTKNN
jgi:hypothetical protein